MSWYEKKEHVTITYEEIGRFSNQGLSVEQLIKYLKNAQEKAIADNADKIWVEIEAHYDQDDRDWEGLIKVQGNRLETNEECANRQILELERRKRQYEKAKREYEYWETQSGKEEIEKFDKLTEQEIKEALENIRKSRQRV